ncbi:glycine cleavage system protein R [Aeromonas molluscorum]|jgi:glycine cleavage system regulatory protein|uniref:Glycine cleavage system transcriptional repressor n=1 Tax=Aeromonas molluscorum 848 TaxID=1268236 RepID=R1HCQ0_9GAMM|nr:ACT domain-containing protein [Aeromonas molluscorum]EOD56174.1 ACT domain-containing protein [Aeromonas molluscorum 848]
MQKQLVVTVIGADRPGIVEELAALISQHSGNWLASSMSELAGQFAGILQISVDDGHYRGLCEALSLLAGLKVSFAEGVLGAEPERQLMLTVTGNDRPGIVHEVASILRQLGANVIDLTTGCEAAPHSGAPLFYAHALVALPQELALPTLIDSLESLSDDLVVDIDQDVED